METTEKSQATTKRAFRLYLATQLHQHLKGVKKVADEDASKKILEALMIGAEELHMISFIEYDEGYDEIYHPDIEPLNKDPWWEKEIKE